MSLPTSDLKYHLYLLLVAVSTDNTDYTRDILECALEFTDCFHDFFLKKDIDEQLFIQMYYLNKAFDDLVNASGTNTDLVLISQSMLALGGSVSGFLCGIVGGFAGGISGFARGLWNQNNLLEYSWTGTFVGVFIGAAVGFRTPQKLIHTPLFRQVKVAMDGLKDTFNQTRDNNVPDLHGYIDKARQILLTDYFDNNVNNLNDCLNSDNVEYEIGTWGAEFVSPILAGSVGHHGFIRVLLNNKYFGMEFTPSPSDFSISPLQSEKRHVSGKKMFEMIGFHLALQETDSFTLLFAATKLKPGETDCVSYINKLLTGTSQEPTRLSRYHATDKPAGHAVRFFIENLAVFPSNLRVLHEQNESENPEQENNCTKYCYT